MNNPIPSLICLIALPVSSHAAATAASSSASDISANISLTGTVVVPIGSTAISVGPLNSASGTAPIPYDPTVSLVTLDSGSGGILDLDLGVDAAEISASSNVDGSEGPKNVQATATITEASAALGLDILGGVDILTLGLDSPLTALSSSSQISWDGENFNSTGISNFITSGTTLTLNLLGQNLTIPALAAGFAVPVPGININALGLTVTGTIFLTADATSANIAGNTAFASATSLLVTTDLHISGPSISLDLDSNIAINPTSAQLTAVPVPEPASPAMLVLATGSLLLRRRR